MATSEDDDKSFDDDDYDMLVSSGPDSPLRDSMTSLPEPGNLLDYQSSFQEAKAPVDECQWDNGVACDFMALSDGHRALQFDDEAVDQRWIDLTVHAVDPHKEAGGALQTQWRPSANHSQPTLAPPPHPDWNAIQVQPTAYFDDALCSEEYPNSIPSVYRQGGPLVPSDFALMNAAIALRACPIDQNILVQLK